MIKVDVSIDKLVKLCLTDIPHLQTLTHAYMHDVQESLHYFEIR